MVLFIIGLGLGDENDISIKGLQAIQSSRTVYLEMYTSILGVQKDRLEKLYGKEVIIADREFCEGGIDQILEDISKQPKEDNYSFLVVGDPFCATTHTDLYLRAVKLKIEIKVIHNASIINAIGCTGLMVYRFGEVISIPFFTEKWRPYSFYNKIEANIKHDLHTLLLLDIKVKEISEENLARGKKIYEPPRFMSTQVAVQQLIETEDHFKTGAYNKDSKCFAVARIGFLNQLIVSGRLSDFLNIDMGEPLHSFVICANHLHPIEEEMFEHFYYKKEVNQEEEKNHD